MNTDPVRLNALLAECPSAYTVWIHSESGRLFTVIGRGIDHASLSPAVVYQANDDGVVWVLSLTEWLAEFVPTEGDLIPSTRGATPCKPATASTTEAR